MVNNQTLDYKTPESRYNYNQDPQNIHQFYVKQQLLMGLELKYLYPFLNLKLKIALSELLPVYLETPCIIVYPTAGGAKSN